MKWCIRTRGCKTAAIKGLREGVGALGKAFGIGTPSGTSTDSAEPSDPVGMVSSGARSLLDNMMSAMNEAVDKWLNEKKEDETDASTENEDRDEHYDWTGHAEKEMMEEDISPDDVYDAIEYPVFEPYPGDNNTTIFPGERATAAVDNDSLLTGRPRIVTVWEQ